MIDHHRCSSCSASLTEKEEKRKSHFQVLEGGLQTLGIKEVSVEKCKKLVGVGTDGSKQHSSIKVKRSCGRVFWVVFFLMWCLAHRLELAVKDALKGTCFNLIDELLLRLYYLYDKSPKRA